MKILTATLRPLALLGLSMLALPSLAQGVYRIVGPDGKVTFSDQPPHDTAARAGGSGNMGNTSGSGQLPYELRQVASRYPVTLYRQGLCTLQQRSQPAQCARHSLRRKDRQLARRWRGP